LDLDKELSSRFKNSKQRQTLLFDFPEPESESLTEFRFSPATLHISLLSVYLTALKAFFSFSLLCSD
jgi:hypothetical protein